MTPARYDEMRTLLAPHVDGTPADAIAPGLYEVIEPPPNWTGWYQGAVDKGVNYVWPSPTRYDYDPADLPYRRSDSVAVRYFSVGPTELSVHFRPCYIPASMLRLVPPPPGSRFAHAYAPPLTSRRRLTL